MNKKNTRLRKYYSYVCSFYRRNSDQIITSAVFAAISVIAGVYLGSSSNHSFSIFLFGVIALFLIIFLFYQLKKVFDQRFDRVSTILIEYFGLAARMNDYYRRKQHFVLEKQTLASALIEDCIPRLLETETENIKDIQNINLFLDAGTTIAEVFPLIVSEGIKTQNPVSINLFTNNLAGIIELHRKGDPKKFKIKESNIHLLGGQPLYDYQAVTGEATVKAIDELCTDKKEQSITIGIITANWIMVGLGMEDIILCARGDGHLNIKKAIINKADYIFIVVPLAKIIRINELDFLNKIKPYDDPYEKYSIPNEKKETTFLLTTIRNSAPLNITSEALIDIEKGERTKNYRLSKFCPEFPINGSTEEIELAEFPQDYVRENKHTLYRINL